MTVHNSSRRSNNTNHVGPAISHQGAHFPAKECLSTTFFCLIVAIGVMPFLAFNLPYDVRQDLPWWKTGVVYQVYPRSFQDSNGDGVGDLKGIESRLDYIQSLGVKAIWISPIFKSPMKDFGYDVEDFKAIDPLFGSMGDFERLINATHNHDLRLILDFVPNHSSDQHAWFKESRKSRTNPYHDYYIWHDGKKLADGSRVPPNNWIGHFGGSSWTWDETRQQYYFHQYLPQQPDLNYRNPRVVKEMKDVLTFWLGKGIDGFRVDAVDSLFETADIFQDEPRSFIEGVKPGSNGYNERLYTLNQPETYDMTMQWRKLLDEHEARTGQHIYMVSEPKDFSKDYRFYKTHFLSGSDQAFNFFLMDAMKNPCDGLCIKKIVDQVIAQTPEDCWPSWVLGSHDVKRISTRAGPNLVEVMNMLNLLLPGTPTTYYGEELGMMDVKVAKEDIQDPFALAQGAIDGQYEKHNRDPCRSPMQWSKEKNAGFSKAPKTWLPVHNGHTKLNVEAQERDQHSTLSHFRQLVRLREVPAIQYGDLINAITRPNLYSFIRKAWGTRLKKYLVVLNLGETPVKEDFTGLVIPKFKWPVNATVVFDTEDRRNLQIVPLDAVTLAGSQGLVLEFHTRGY